MRIIYIFHCCCCCCCCCSHINSHNQVRGHRTGSSHSVWSWGIPQGSNTNNPRWYTRRLYHSWRNSCLHQKHLKVKSGVSLRMCQVHTGAYVSFLTPGETNYSDCHPRKTTTYILHVVSITTHTHDRHKSIREKKQRKENKIQERKEKRKKRNKTKNSYI